MTAVSVVGVSKTFPGRPPVAALRGIDLEIGSGAIVAVLGPSGCGKTTLLRAIAGFEPVDAGTIALGDDVVSRPGWSLPPERRKVGIVPQEGALFPHLDVAGNVGYALRSGPHAVSRAAARDRVGELLELVGLVGYERRRPHELSGGQQQRVSLARALAARPAVVLLDEPFTALDAGLRSRLRADVAAVLREAKTTAVLVTHDPEEALAMADEVAVMSAGRILQSGPSYEIYHHPVDAEVATMLGDVIVLAGQAHGPTASCALGELTLSTVHGEVTGPVELVLRPEQVTADPISEVIGRVVEVSFNGHDALVALEVADQPVTARWPGSDLPIPGTEVGLRVRGTALAVPLAVVAE